MLTFYKLIFSQMPTGRGLVHACLRDDRRWTMIHKLFQFFLNLLVLLLCWTYAVNCYQTIVHGGHDVSLGKVRTRVL